jgi:hypothetical protein
MWRSIKALWVTGSTKIPETVDEEYNAIEREFGNMKKLVDQIAKDVAQLVDGFFLLTSLVRLVWH